MSKLLINEILNSDRNYILKLNKQKESLFHEMAWSNDTSLLDKYINGYSKLLSYKKYEHTKKIFRDLMPILNQSDIKGRSIEDIYKIQGNEKAIVKLTLLKCLNKQISLSISSIEQYDVKIQDLPFHCLYEKEIDFHGLALRNSSQLIDEYIRSYKYLLDMNNEKCYKELFKDLTPALMSLDYQNRSLEDIYKSHGNEKAIIKLALLKCLNVQIEKINTLLINYGAKFDDLPIKSLSDSCTTLKPKILEHDNIENIQEVVVIDNLSSRNNLHFMPEIPNSDQSQYYVFNVLESDLRPFDESPEPYFEG